MRFLPGSLRGRLLVALMSAIVVCVGGWLCAYGTMVDRQQTGWWDSTLRVIAHQILLSLPGGLTDWCR